MKLNYIIRWDSCTTETPVLGRIKDTLNNNFEKKIW